MDDRFFDLLGDPFPPERSGRGRPPHVPDDQKRLKIMLLLALDKTEDECAAAIGITAKTLRKHYSRQLRVRDQARQRLDGELLATLAREAAGGNVGALKELNRVLEKHDQVRLSKSVANRSSAESGERPVPLGKKELARQAAHGVQGKFAPPPAPRLIN